VHHLYPSLNGLQAAVSITGFRDYQGQSQVFQRAAVETGWGPNLTGEGDPEQLNAERVTGDYFTSLGVPAALGRTLRADEAELGHDHVVVLSHAFWRGRFGADPAAVGRRVVLNGEQYEIVGVMPPRFRDFFNRAADLWAPLAFRPDQLTGGQRTSEFLNFTGRLAAGTSVDQAQREMHGFAQRLKKDYPDAYPPDWDLLVTSLDQLGTRPVRTALLVLLGAVGFVLLIACANVANLQLARASARSREIAVRVALGASPRRLMRYLITESVVLALCGGGLGLLLALWGVPALLSLSNRNLPPANEIGIDGVVLGFTLLVSLLTGFVFGILPALQVARTDLHGALKEGGRGSAGTRGSLALRRGLVVTTVALALMLLAGAGLLMKSFARLVHVDPGFRPERLLTVSVTLPRTRYPNDTVRVQAIEQLTAAIAAVPGVEAVGGTTVMPFGGSWSTGSFSVEGYQAPPGTPGPWGDIRIVTSGFLTALGVPLRAGRPFTDHDAEDAPRVAIVDEEMVSRYWPGQNPIGKRLTFQDLTDSSITWIEVVGVVGHTMHEGLDGGRRVQMYLPLRQAVQPGMVLGVRTRGEPLAALGAVRAAVRSVDADLPLARVSTMEQNIERSTGPRRFSMLLLGGFAILALVLASIGLYGVMSYSVTQRTQEIGVRIALGARAREVQALVLGQGMRLTLVGVAIGLAGGVGMTRFMRSMLFNVSATDPATFGVIALVLVGVSALASWLPALRAARVDPMVALRSE
jgi:predicted permease